MKKTLFVSDKSLVRCENLTAVWNRYQYPKHFLQINYSNSGQATLRQVLNDDYGVLITDGFMTGNIESFGITTVVIRHGMLCGKTYGFAQPHITLGIHPGSVSYIVSESPSMSESISKYAHVPVERCVPLGFPRTDDYYTDSGQKKQKGDGYTIFSEKKMYLYVPTFRHRMWEGQFPIPDFELIDAYLTDDEMFVVKRHPVLRSPLLRNKKYKHIVEVSNEEPSAAYLIDCDVLITDYSSIMFDGYLLEKPSVLFAKDKDNYLKKRGMFLDYPSCYSTRFCNEESSLVPLLREAALNGMNEIETTLIRREASMCDGHSTERVVEFIKNIITS